MLKLIFAFVAALGIGRGNGHRSVWRPEPDWPDRRCPRQGDDKVRAAARRALDGVDHPLIL